MWYLHHIVEKGQACIILHNILAELELSGRMNREVDGHGTIIGVVTSIPEDEEGLQDDSNAESDANEESTWDEVHTTRSIYTSPAGFPNLGSSLLQQASIGNGNRR